MVDLNKQNKAILKNLLYIKPKSLKL